MFNNPLPTPIEINPFLQDYRLEESLVEILTYVHGLSIPQGTHENQAAFVQKISNIPLYQMFNKNILSMFENDIITDAVIRDFILNLSTRFNTIMHIRNSDFNHDYVIDKLAFTVVDSFSVGNFDSELNKTLVASLSSGILPYESNLVRNYLNKNKWFSILVLINVFSIQVLKVMGDIKRPPVNSEGT